jgi:hypothetical protein
MDESYPAGVSDGESPSPETGTQQATGTDPSIPGSQGPQGQPDNRIPYARFQQVIQRANGAEQRATSAEQRAIAAERAVADLKTIVSKAQDGQRLTPEEQLEYRAATGKLREIFGHDEDLSALLKAKEYHGKVDTLAERLEKLEQGGQSGAVRDARAHLAGLASKAGYSDRQAQHLDSVVASIIANDPNAKAAYLGGDHVRAIDWAFKIALQDFPVSAARVANTQVAGAKQRLANLPPAPTRTGAPARPQPPPPPANVRDRLDAAHQRFSALLAERSAEGAG